MKNIKVSVVIPAFNAELYIGSLLEKFESQTYDNWELLIVDDWSTDNTTSIIEEYAGKDNRIKLMVRDREPKGAQTCRNIGISKAKGDYIIIIDADDLIANCFINQRVEYMINNPDVDYVTFKGQSFSFNNAISYGRLWGVQPDKDILSCFLRAEYPFGVWNNIYKSTVVKNLLFDENIKVYMDFDFIIRTILSGYKHSFAEKSEIDYFYRQGHSGRITSSFISDNKYDSTKYLFKKTMDLLSKLNNFKIYKKDFFQFHLLQYEKVLIGGSIEQCEDFKDFINKEYGFPNNIRINLSWVILKRFVKKRSRKLSAIVYFTIYILFSPSKLIKWFINKILIIESLIL